MEIKSVYDEEFKPYGQVLEGYDFTELFRTLSVYPVPGEGIQYEPSIQELENCQVFKELQDKGFGGMPIQLGYCNGTNDRLNCLEYHKSSEFNIAGDDIVLMLGLKTEIENGCYHTERIKIFYIPAGTGVELYSTTLHYAPCGYKGNGFRMVCALPRGTNIGMPELEKRLTMEEKMCLGTNKWLLAHPESEEAERSYVGLKGENLRYVFEKGREEG